MKMWTEEGERVSKSRAARTQYDPETGRGSGARATRRRIETLTWWGEVDGERVSRHAEGGDEVCADTGRGDHAGGRGGSEEALCYHHARAPRARRGVASIYIDCRRRLTTRTIT